MNKLAHSRNVAIIGAGPMGLAAAYELAKSGACVTVLERDERIGGMSAAVDFDGLRIERYYHFVCKPDEPLFAYLREFGMEKLLKWRRTFMGFYFQGKLYDWGHPLALLKFPGLNLIEKLRYGAHVMHAKSIKDWRPYDGFSSTAWLKKWIGQRAYDVLWRSLFHFKFYELQDNLSAAWLGTRIKRVALSRKSLFEEEMGYLEGGSEVLLEAVAEKIEALGGQIRLGAGVEEVVLDAASQRVTGVHIGGQVETFDQIISTIPLPYLPRLIPALPAAEKNKIAAIRNVGVVCVLLKLKRPFTRNFWLNINDPRIEIPGLIEYSNLNPLGDKNEFVIYAPYYMPQTHPKYQRPFQEFIDETLRYMKMIRPDFDTQDVTASIASRYEYSQTVCAPGFFEALPAMQSSVSGLFMADTSHYYPEDRSISESMRVGTMLARMAAV